MNCVEEGIVIFDTDILIWIQRGNEKAAKWLQQEKDRAISLQTYLELMQYAASKKQHAYVHAFLRDFEIATLPFTEPLGHRAAVYIEEYSLSHGLCAGDAIIAATAVENGQALASGNRKHFRAIKELNLKWFKP